LIATSRGLQGVAQILDVAEQAEVDHAVLDPALDFLGCAFAEGDRMSDPF
jgi:hypothetical protein